MEFDINGVSVKGLGQRLFGFCIIIKTMLPVLIVVVLVSAFSLFVNNVGESISRAQDDLDPQFEAVNTEIGNIKVELKRLYDEVNKIKNETKELTGDVKKSIEPVRKSLLGVAGSLKVISNTLENLLNSLIRTVKKLPGMKKLNYVNLPNVEIPGLRLPNLDIDINLEPDLRAIYALQAQLEILSSILDRTFDGIYQAYTQWLGMMKLLLVMFALWLLFVITAFILGVKQRLIMGARLMLGKPVDNALQYF